MRRIGSLAVSFAVCLIVIAFIVVEARTKSPAGWSEYYCPTNTDPVCECISRIGDEEACTGKKTTQDPEGGGGETTNWGTECNTNARLCVGWTTCPDGTRLQCLGEFTAQADEAGVRCTDTGGSGGLADQDYCQD